MPKNSRKEDFIYEKNFKIQEVYKFESRLALTLKNLNKSVCYGAPLEFASALILSWVSVVMRGIRLFIIKPLFNLQDAPYIYAM